MRQTISIILLIMILIASCTIDREKSIDRSRFTFSVTPDSHLFFKNVRQIYYDFTDLKEAKLHVYRLSSRATDSATPHLHPVIVVDRIKEEAYILIEANEILEGEVLTILETAPASGQVYSYSLNERGRENMLEFATKLYEGILAGSKFRIVVQGAEIPFLVSEEQRENFRIVMADYYRLTRVIR